MRSKKVKGVWKWIWSGVFLVFVLIVTIGMIIGPPSQDGEATTTHPKTGSSTTKNDAAAQEAKSSKEKKLPAPVFDDEGLAIMPVTSDPREAAAGAAAVLWSINTHNTKFAEDFRQVALTRVMQPSPDYVGATGQIQTGIDPETGKLAYLDPLKATLQATATMSYRPDGWWWMLGDETSVAALRGRSAIVKSHALQVYDQDEMREYDNTVSTTFSSQADSTVKAEGATLGIYWVRTESELQVGETVQQRFPAVFAIYCDPPEDGGICGVAGLMTDYPQAWQRQ